MTKEPAAARQTTLRRDPVDMAAKSLTDKDTKVHIPAFMPFFWLALASIARSILSEKMRFNWLYWLAGSMVCLVILFALPRPKPLRRVPLSMLGAAFCLMGMLFQFSLPGTTPSDIRSYIGEGSVVITGRISEPPESSGSTARYVIATERLEVRGISTQKVKGKVMISLPMGFDFKYGDLLEVSGELITPPAGTGGAWRVFLEHRGIYAYSQFGQAVLLERGGGNPLLTALYSLREKGARVIDRIFPAPENALLRGILLGDESLLSQEMRQAYAITGTSHIIAISGFNMAVLSAITAHLFTRHLGRLKGSLLAIGVLLFYTILVGASASVMRAAFMGAFTVVASAIARRGNSLNNLGLSVLLMMMINPHLPWDIGFQLSAMATLGLALLMPPLRARLTLWLNKRFGEEVSARFGWMIGDYLIVTLVAQASVLPLVLYHFKSLSWVFLIANPLILPVQPLVMVLGLTAMSAGMMSLAFGKLFAWLAWPFAAYTNRLVLWFAAFYPQTLRFPQLDFFWVAMAYLLFALCVSRYSLKQWFSFFSKPALILAALVSLCATLWSSVAALPDGRLSIYIFGQSSTPMMLLRSPGGQYVLVNGESEPAMLRAEIEPLLPPFNQQLAAIVIPDCKMQQLSALFGITRQIDVGQVLWGCNPESRQISERLWEAFASEGVRQVRLTGNEMLSVQTGSLSFELGNEKMRSLKLEMTGFNGDIYFEPGVEKNKSELMVVEPYNAAMAPSMAQVWVLTGYTSPNLPANALFAADYRWLRLETDGQQVWFSKRSH